MNISQKYSKDDASGSEIIHIYCQMILNRLNREYNREDKLIFYFISYILNITRKYCDNALFDEVIKDLDDICRLYNKLNNIKEGCCEKLIERKDLAEIKHQSYPITESSERREYMRTVKEYRSIIEESKYKKSVKEFYKRINEIDHLVKKYNIKYITGETYGLLEREMKDEYEKLLKNNKAFSLALSTKKKNESIQELNDVIRYIEKHINELNSESKQTILNKIESIKKYLLLYPNDELKNYTNTTKNLIRATNSKNPNFIKTI